MAIRKNLAPATTQTTAAPAQEGDDVQAAAPAIPGAGGGLTASEQAYGGQGETQQLQMQMQMDRRSKLTSTMSNVSKKVADSADNITDNLK